MGKQTKSKPKRKIGSQQNSPKKMIKGGIDPNYSDSPLTFNFAKENWLKSVAVKGFTNKLKDPEMFSEYIFEVFYKTIPTLHEHGDNIIKNGGKSSWKHCHPIRNDELDKAIEIAESIHGSQIKEVSEGSKLWQFGFIGGIRLIAIHNYKSNYLTPLFVDYHHQIYPSQKHNEKDIKSFPFCPVNAYT